MNPSSQYPHRRRLTRAEARRRRRNRAIRRVAGLTLVACALVGGVSFLLHRKAPVPAASALSQKQCDLVCAGRPQPEGN